MEYKIFGCKVNKFYINKWMDYFKLHPSFSDEVNGYERVIVATCVVTDRAKAKWVKYAKQQLALGKYVYLTGCGAFEKGEAMDYDAFFAIYPDLKPYKEQLFLLGEDPATYDENLQVAEYELNKEMDFESGAQSSSDLSGVKVDQQGDVSHGIQDLSENALKVLKKKQESNPLYTRKFIVIQSGCDTFCTFCLTIYKRGSNRNRSADDIIAEINEFVAAGGKEIIITGVNLAAWGATNTRKPEESKFSDLLESIIEKTTIERIRISSLGPEFLDDKFFELMKNTRFLPHFHFSIQSFSGKVLKLMNRNYGEDVLDDVLTKIRQIDRPDTSSISIGADIIVGFPGEDEEEFSKTYEGIEKYGITKLHAFPFSPHQKGETVPAGKLKEQVDHKSKKERERRLIQFADKFREDFVATQKGQKFTALLENQKDGKWLGWTENYIQVELEGDYKRGDLVEVVL